jgi:ABC-type Fe3+ transport system permease subunit
MQTISKLLVIFSIFLLPLFIVAPVSAQFNPFEDVCEGNEASSGSGVCSEDGSRDPITGPNGIIMTAVRILSFVVGVASVIMVIVGGLKYIMSNGDSNAISSAKNTILYAIIGLVIFAVSQAIVAFVVNRL